MTLSNNELNTAAAHFRNAMLVNLEGEYPNTAAALALTALREERISVDAFLTQFFQEFNQVLASPDYRILDYWESSCKYATKQKPPTSIVLKFYLPIVRALILEALIKSVFDELPSEQQIQITRSDNYKAVIKTLKNKVLSPNISTTEENEHIIRSKIRDFFLEHPGRTFFLALSIIVPAAITYPMMLAIQEKFAGNYGLEVFSWEASYEEASPYLLPLDSYQFFSNSSSSLICYIQTYSPPYMYLILNSTLSILSNTTLPKPLGDFSSSYSVSSTGHLVALHDDFYGKLYSLFDQKNSICSYFGDSIIFSIQANSHDPDPFLGGLLIFLLCVVFILSIAMITVTLRNFCRVMSQKYGSLDVTNSLDNFINTSKWFFNLQADVAVPAPEPEQSTALTVAREAPQPRFGANMPAIAVFSQMLQGNEQRFQYFMQRFVNNTLHSLTPIARQMQQENIQLRELESGKPSNHSAPVPTYSPTVMNAPV